MLEAFENKVGEVASSLKDAGATLGESAYSLVKEHEFVAGAIAGGAATTAVFLARRWLAPVEAAVDVARATGLLSAEPAALAAKAAERISALYPLTEPRLAVHLTNPNVVLTLAGARGQTEFHIVNPKLGDEAAFQPVVEAAEKFGIRFSPRRIKLASNGTMALQYDVQSLEGYERTTVESSLPGSRPFYAKEGWDGLAEWNRQVRQDIGAAKEQGLYSADTRLPTVMWGLRKGYPDRAIARAAETPLATFRSDLLATHIPYADYYRCPQPNYSFDANDFATIQPHVSRWGSVLSDYYNSASHVAMRSDPTFMRHRLLADRE